MKVNQPTAAPTRKLTAAMIAAAIVETSRTVADVLWPGIFDGAFWIALLPIVIFAVGYFVRDEANVVPDYTGTDL